VYENKSSYPLANSEPIHTDKLNTAIVQNFLKKLNNPPMSVSNAWLDFQKFVDLFYQMINPVAPFINTSSNRAPFPCPPDPQPCWNFSNFYTDAMGLYKRPVSSTTTEGTGFNIKTAVPGDGVTHSVVNVAFTLFKVGAPFPCPPDPQPCWNLEYLNNRYFALNSNGATDDWDVFWYDYDGTGVQPTYVGPGGVITYNPIAIVPGDTLDDLQTKTNAAVVATGFWAVTALCPPFSPSCGAAYATTFTADVVGTRFDAVDGRGGYEEVVTTMKASDATTIATGLITDTAWQNAHNDLRIPYEKLTFNDDYMYLKAISAIGDNVDGEPCTDCCPGVPENCISVNVFLQTVGISVLNDIPVNAPGVLSNNAAGNKRLLVID